MSPSEARTGRPAEITRPMLSWFFYVLSQLDTDGLDKTVIECEARYDASPARSRGVRPDHRT